MPGLDITQKYNYNITSDGKIYAEEINKINNALATPIDVTGHGNGTVEDRLLRSIDTLVKNTLLSTVPGTTVLFNRFDVHRVGITTPIDSNNLKDGSLVTFVTHVTNVIAEDVTPMTIRIGSGSYIPVKLFTGLMPVSYIVPGRIYILRYNSNDNTFTVMNDDSHKADLHGDRNNKFEADDPVGDYDVVNLRTLTLLLDQIDISGFWVLNEPNTSTVTTSDLHPASFETTVLELTNNSTDSDPSINIIGKDNLVTTGSGNKGGSFIGAKDKFVFNAANKLGSVGRQLELEIGYIVPNSTDSLFTGNNTVITTHPLANNRIDIKSNSTFINVTSNTYGISGSLLDISTTGNSTRKHTDIQGSRVNLNLIGGGLHGNYKAIGSNITFNISNDFISDATNKFIMYKGSTNYPAGKTIYGLDIDANRHILSGDNIYLGSKGTTSGNGLVVENGVVKVKNANRNITIEPTPTGASFNIDNVDPSSLDVIANTVKNRGYDLSVNGNHIYHNQESNNPDDSIVMGFRTLYNNNTINRSNIFGTNINETGVINVIRSNVFGNYITMPSGQLVNSVLLGYRVRSYALQVNHSSFIGSYLGPQRYLGDGDIIHMHIIGYYSLGINAPIISTGDRKGFYNIVTQGSYILPNSNASMDSILLGYSIGRNPKSVFDRTIVMGKEMLNKATNVFDSIVMSPSTTLPNTAIVSNTIVIASTGLSESPVGSTCDNAILIGNGLEMPTVTDITDTTIISSDFILSATDSNFYRNTIIGAKISSRSSWGMNDNTIIGMDIALGGSSTHHSTIIGQGIGAEVGEVDIAKNHRFINCTVIGRNIATPTTLPTAGYTNRFRNCVAIGQVYQFAHTAEDGLAIGSQVLSNLDKSSDSLLGIGFDVAHNIREGVNTYMFGQSLLGGVDKIERSIILGNGILHNSNTVSYTNTMHSMTLIGQDIGNHISQPANTDLKGCIALGNDIFNLGTIYGSIGIGTNVNFKTNGGISGGNISIGKSVGTYRKDYINNVVIGDNAGGIDTGLSDKDTFSSEHTLTNSVLIGKEAGYNSSNTGCVGIGNSALKYVSPTTALRYYKVGIGMYAGYGNGGSYQISIGYKAHFYNNSSNSISIGRESGKRNNTRCISIGDGAAALMPSNAGTDCIFIGTEAGGLVDTGADCVLIGHEAMVNGTGDGQFVLGGNYINVLRCAVSTISTLSDRRDKKDIISSTGHLDFINALNPVSYKWDPREANFVNLDNPNKQGNQVGFIAQELEKVCSEFGELGDMIAKKGLVDTTNPDRFEVGEAALIPSLVGAIKELTNRIKKLETLIEG